jgi:transposase-like protein
MANALSVAAQDQVRSLYLAHGSIKAVCRQLGVGRNTVRRLIRGEGLIKSNAEPQVQSRDQLSSLSATNICLIRALFEASKDTNERLDFEKDIRPLIESLAKDICIRTATDQFRLSLAMEQLLIYRRFYLKSVKVSDVSYDGPFKRCYEKEAKAINSWVEVANKALEQCMRLLRELEYKNGKRSPQINQGVFVQNNSINLNATG